MNSSFLLASVSRPSVTMDPGSLGLIAQTSPPPAGRTDATVTSSNPSNGGTQDERRLGHQLRESIRAGQDPWAAAGALLKGASPDQLASSSDPLLQFFGRYMKPAAKAKISWPDSHREAVGNLKTVLSAMSKSDTEAFLRSAAGLGLNLGFKALVDAATKANADPVLVAAFMRSFGAKDGASNPGPQAAPNQQQPPSNGSGPSPTSGSRRAADTSTPLTAASGEELTARWIGGESWYDIAAEIIAGRTAGSITQAEIDALPATPGLKEAVYALNVMQGLGLTVERSGEASGGGSRYVMRPAPTADGGSKRIADLGLVTSWNSLLGNLGVEPAALRSALGAAADAVIDTYNRLKAESDQIDQQRLSPTT